MKQLLILIFSSLVLFNSGCSQNNSNNSEKILLRWKINGDYLAFKSSSFTKEGSLGLNFDIDKIGKSFGLPLDSLIGELKVNFPSSSESYIVLLPVEQNLIDVKFIIHNMEEPANENEQMNEMMKKLMDAMKKQKVQLRGQINNIGEITSFWLPIMQKNLLTGLFQLPKDSITIGDEWEIDVNLLQMNGNFICAEAKKVSYAKLSAIVKDEADIIAVIDYSLDERVEGEFINPLNAEPIESSMSIKTIAKGEFYVNKGYWKKFTSVMEMDSKGFNNSHSVSNDILVPVNNIPEEYLELE